jgi:thiamine-phosphate pyrophosphorylase
MKTMCVTGRSAGDDAAFDGLLAGFADDPPDWFEVRAREATDRRTVELLRRAIAALGAGRVLGNGRFDLALAAGAAGVVLPEDGLPLEAVRRETPRGFRVGKSTHSAGAAADAAAAGADIVLLGPIFDTPSKRRFGPPLSASAVEDAAAGWTGSAELYLIGGMDAARAAGFAGRVAGFAAIRAFEEASDPGAVVREARATNAPAVHGAGER